MKLNKILAGIISGVIAAASMATSASAYLTVPSSQSSLLTANNQSWSKMINSSYDIDYSKLAQIQATFTLTDPAAYEAEKASGFYADGETVFGDFAGNLAFGSTVEWIPFNYSSIADTAGDASNATITSLGGGSYIMTGNFTSTQAAAITGRCSITFAEWGNTSDKYELTLNYVSLIDTSGNVMLEYDGAGNAVVEPAVIVTTTTEAPVETTTTTEATTTTPATTTTTTTTTTTEATTTTPEETTTVPEETEESAEETTTAETTTTTTTTTTTAAETTAAEATTTTTAAATTTAAVEQAVASDADNFASRNSQLMIFAIAAVVIIVAVIIAFVLISLKKKR